MRPRLPLRSLKMIKGNKESGAVYIGDKRLPEWPSQALVNHSPDGFSWGYGGSGPAQFALALILRFTDSEQKALKYYQKFKSDVVARLYQDDFEMEESVVTDWIKENIKEE
jgi:hypothetical protein